MPYFPSDKKLKPFKKIVIYLSLKSNKNYYPKLSHNKNKKN